MTRPLCPTRLHALAPLTAFCALLVTLATPARADIPTMSVAAERDGDRVRLDIEQNDQTDRLGSPECTVSIERDGIEIHDGALGERSRDASEVLGFDDEPLGYWRTNVVCEPFFDTPCDGEHEYTVRWAALQQATSAEASVLVDWSPANCEATAGGDAGDGAGDGGGCAAGGVPESSAHLFVLLVLLAGALVPTAMRRRGHVR